MSRNEAGPNSMNTTMYFMSLAEHIRLKSSRVCHCKWYHRHRVRQQEGTSIFWL